jgi:hypothetical protein
MFFHKLRQKFGRNLQWFWHWALMGYFNLIWLNLTHFDSFWLILTQFDSIWFNLIQFDTICLNWDKLLSYFSPEKFTHCENFIKMLKGPWHEVSNLCFFHQTSPGLLIHRLKPFWIWLCIHEDNQHSWSHSNVINTALTCTAGSLTPLCNQLF